MPAHKKYLSNSPWFKLGKLSAAILGGLVASISLHLALATWMDKRIVVPTAIFSSFLVWVLFMLLTYWIRKVLHVWMLLGGIIIISAIAIHLGL